MDEQTRRLRRKANEVGLDITGPYFNGPRGEDVYALFENATGDLLGQQLTREEIAVEIARHHGVTRLAEARRRRR